MGPSHLRRPTADCFTWAHCIFCSCCQWLRLGPEIFWESLPIQRMGQLHFLLLLPMALVWPIHFLVGASDAQGWAHCIFGCCCRWLRFGPLTFWEALPRHTDGPIA